MDYFRFLSLCSIIIYLVVIGRFAVASNWETWHEALPNTQMPNSLLKILQPSDKEAKSENPSDYLGIGKTVLNLNDDKNLQQGSVFPTAGEDSYATGPNKGPKEPVTIPSDITTFFLEQVIHSGTKMTLLFPKTTSNPTRFLPRHVTTSIPFSSKKFPVVLRRFSVIPGSREAEVMRETIVNCEAPSVRGEEKYCADSLQSMIGFGVSRLGPDVDVFGTDQIVATGEKRMFRVDGARKVGEKSVVCHKKNYVYAVFYCHAVHSTRSYVVSLVGEGGERAEAVAVCHTDTRYWSAELLVFKVLNVKPGTVPVCHFLPSDNLVWVPK